MNQWCKREQIGSRLIKMSIKIVLTWYGEKFKSPALALWIEMAFRSTTNRTCWVSSERENNLLVRCHLHVSTLHKQCVTWTGMLVWETSERQAETDETLISEGGPYRDLQCTHGDVSIVWEGILNDMCPLVVSSQRRRTTYILLARWAIVIVELRQKCKWENEMECLKKRIGKWQEQATWKWRVTVIND